MREQHYVESDDLAVAWARSLRTMEACSGGAISPFMVTVTGFADGRPAEAARIRDELGYLLERWGEATCDTVANTIFPDAMWNRNTGAVGRRELYRHYLRLVPRLRRICPPNRYGTYFERLIDYRGAARNGAAGTGVNQLEHVIRAFTSGHRQTPIRHSALIAAIFHPEVDHTCQPRRGFPCMHQVTFEPHGRDGLGVTAFYATQHYHNKAYGNLLGLSRLGFFMAHALSRQLVRISCVASVAGLGCTKARARELLTAIGPLPDGEEDRTGGIRA